MEGPRRSGLDFEEEMDVAAVGTHDNTGENLGRPRDRRS